MKKAPFVIRLFLIAAVCLVLSACSASSIPTKAPDNSTKSGTSEWNNPNKPSTNPTTGASDWRDPGQEWKDPNKPTNGPDITPTESPYFLRQDYYWKISEDPEKQELAVLSKDGLQIISLSDQPKWNYVILKNYQGSFDGRSLLLFLSTEEVVDSLGKSGMPVGVFSHDRSDSLFMAEHQSYMDLVNTSWDGAAMIVDGVTKKEYTQGVWLEKEDGSALLTDQSRKFHSAFSPDSRTVMYSVMTSERTADSLAHYQITCLLPDGRKWEWSEEGCIGIALSDGGEYVYLVCSKGKDAYSKFYVQRRDDPSTRILLGDALGNNYSFNHVITSLSRSEFTLNFERYGLLFFTGPIFNMAADQVVFCQMEDFCTYYSENGQERKLLFEQPAAPVMPQSIAVKEMSANSKSGASSIGAHIFSFGLRRLNQVVYQSAEKENYTCDLYWVDENWNTKNLASGVESRTIHISEDGTILHYVKDGNLYCMVLSGDSFQEKLLAEKLGREEKGSYFWVSYDGTNAIWFDDDGKIYTVNVNGNTNQILHGLSVNCNYDICPVGDKGFLCRADGKIYYVESKAEEVSGLKGDFPGYDEVEGGYIFTDCEGTYCLIIGADDEMYYMYYTVDGKNFELVYSEEIDD